MASSGPSFYHEEIKELHRLLKRLPDNIPVGNAHNFIGYVPDGKAVDEDGRHTVVAHDLGRSFGARRTPAGEDIIVAFKSRGPALEEVVTVLRDNITGSGGPNVLLTKWVDDLRIGARAAIEAAGTPMNWPFADLVDDPPPEPPATAAPIRGRPKSTLLDDLTIPCHSLSNNTARIRCSGTDCQESWAVPRQSGRVLAHAVDCRFLSKELKDRALLENAKNSLAARTNTSETATKPTDMFSAFRVAGTETKAQQRKQHVDKTNHLLLELLCDGALPPKLVDRPTFRAFVNHLDPTNGICVSTTFSTNHIPAEAARVTVLSLEKLKTLHNLTITYDGGTTRGHQSIYTVHVTTPDREPHLIKGDEASGYSHTGEHIKKVLMEVMKEIGLERFAGIASDNTGNTTVARVLCVDDVPTLLICPDPCHHLSNTVGDIVKLPYFENATSKARTVISHFSHSSNSHTHLSALRVCLSINHGLETVGKTRFGTWYWVGYALIPCLVPISQLINLGVISVDGDKDKAALGFFKQFRILQDFELELKQLVLILEPLARAIKCLEGLQVTVGDVWKFYVAITAVLRELFEEDTLSFPQELKDDVCAIINRRFDQMIHGPSGDLFLSGFYLDPEHVKSPVLFRRTANQLDPASSLAAVPVPVSSSQVTDQDLRDSMPAYQTVGKFLLTELAKELRAGRKDRAFVPYNSAAQILNAFKIQFQSYTRQYPPFSARSPLWNRPILYWESMYELPDASILAFIAIKILSILPNSMAEERTVSRFTRLNSVDRSRQDASTLVAMTKIYQHIRREAEPQASKKKSVSAPAMNWRSIRGLMSKLRDVEPEVEVVQPPSADSAATPGLGDTRSEASEAGLEAMNAALDQQASEPEPDVFRETSIASHRDGVDISLPYFRDLLSDKPITGADTVGSLWNWAERDAGDGEKRGRAARNTTWEGELNTLSF
ncbi:DUF659 family protein [Favolaschia claudopus]|uniref:DUF659 family protein n=1 Tax=Favolaschia claudopus TaxID=2862362 RepID=A0AAV9ZMZ4_9AGAR